jgi:diaminopimelate epimerase
MQTKFYKYQGTGNDFIILDNRKGHVGQLTWQQVAGLCNRRFGIGGDGLMLLSAHPEYDFEMVYFNSDGKPSSMCGNGGRCLVKFAYDLGLTKTTYHFIAIDGPHEASVNNDGSVALKMNDVRGIKNHNGKYILNTGSPHFIDFSDDVMHLDVFKKGRAIRYSPQFEKEGINVNFVEQTQDVDQIIVRTYERGVEDETLSCGTGVTAAALVCFHNDMGFNRVEVKTKGGQLSVEYDKSGDEYTNIWLNGPAEKVFEGTIDLDLFTQNYR